jgi:uncharacterized protein (DUF2384 family)
MASSSHNQGNFTENTPPSFKEVAEFLGMEAEQEVTGRDIADHISTGFPESALDRLAQALAPDDPAFKCILMDAPGTQSSSADQRLRPRESGLVYRLASVWIMALRAYKDPEIARSFLFSENPLLFGETPYSRIRKGQQEAQIVFGLLPKRYGPDVYAHAYWLD